MPSYSNCEVGTNLITVIQSGEKIYVPPPPPPPPPETTEEGDVVAEGQAEQIATDAVEPVKEEEPKKEEQEKEAQAKKKR